MNTKSSKKKVNEIQNAFNDLFLNTSEPDQVELEAKILVAKFLSEIQEIADEKGIKRNELASKIGTSASYLTQLFRGHKLPNFNTLAKFQKALDIEFSVGIANKQSIINPINADNVADLLDKWHENKADGSFLKIIKSAQINLGNIDYNDHKKRAV